MKSVRRKLKIRLSEWVAFVALLPFIILVFVAVFCLKMALDHSRELPNSSVTESVGSTSSASNISSSENVSSTITTSASHLGDDGNDRDLSGERGNLLVFDGVDKMVMTEFISLDKDVDGKGRIWSDFTFVNDKLWVFFPSGDEEHIKNDGLIRIYDPESGNLEKSFYHNFGHVNTVDYNERTDQLLVGNLPGNEQYPAAIYIFDDVSLWETEEDRSRLPFSQRVSRIIDVSSIHSTGSGKYSSATVACWGESDDVVYVNGLYNRYWWKIQLGIGETCYDKGTYSVVAADELNGTYKVVWFRKFVGKYDANREVTQGIFYRDGTIHTANGHNEIQWWEWTANATGVSRTEHNIAPIQVDGKVKYCISEGIAEWNGYVYIGCLFTDMGADTYAENHGVCTGEHGVIRVKLD